MDKWVKDGQSVMVVQNTSGDEMFFAVSLSDAYGPCGACSNGSPALSALLLDANRGAALHQPDESGQQVDKSAAPGLQAVADWHADYPAVREGWIQKHPAQFFGPKRARFQAEMCEALHNGVTLADVAKVFARPDCTPALAPWDVKEMLMKECHMRQFAERNG